MCLFPPGKVKHFPATPLRQIHIIYIVVNNKTAPTQEQQMSLFSERNRERTVSKKFKYLVANILPAEELNYTKKNAKKF